MNKKIIITVSAILSLGVAGYIYYGFTPLKIYYPNGQLQSEAPRKFYKKEGMAFEYYEDGHLKMETPYQGGLKHGIQVNHFKDRIRLETPYQNGKKEGTAKLSYSPQKSYSFPFHNNQLVGKIQLNENTIVQVDTNRQFTIQDQVKGRLVCDDLELIQNITVQDVNKRLMGIAKCVAIENFNYQNVGNPPLSIQFDGAFQYPSFTKTTTIELTDEHHLLEKQNPLADKESKNEPAYLSELKTYSQHYLVQNGTITIDENNKNIYFKGFNKNKDKLFEIDLDSSDISAIVENLYKFAQTEKEEILLEVFRKININKYLLFTPQGKKNAELVGKIGFGTETGFIENGTHFDLFSAQEKPVLKLTKIENGLNIKIAYPNGDKDFFTADIKIDCPELDELIKKFKDAQTLNEEELSKIRKSINPFALIPNTVTIPHLRIKNHAGQDVLTVNDFVIEPFTQSVTGSIQLSNNAKPYRIYNFKGNSDTVEMVANGETSEISVQQIPETISQDWINEQRSKIAEAWIKEAKAEIESENKTSLTFAYIGGIEGYNTAIKRFDATTIIDIVDKYIALIENGVAASAETNNLNSYQIPTLAETGLQSGIEQMGVQIETTDISNKGIALKISFSEEKVALCQAVAKEMDEPCQDLSITFIYPSELVIKAYSKQNVSINENTTPSNEEAPLALENSAQQAEEDGLKEPISTEAKDETLAIEEVLPAETVMENNVSETANIEALLLEEIEISSPVIAEIPTPKISSAYPTTNEAEEKI